MSDEREYPPYPGDASGHLRPGLINAYAKEQPEDQPYAADAVNKVQDYLTGKAMFAKAQDASDRFVNDLAATRQNLSGMVRTDPFSTRLALSLVPDAIGNLTAHHPDQAERADAAGTIADHLRNEIAIAGIQAHAGLSREAGHAAIDQFGAHLNPGEESVLRDYTDNIDSLRQADNNAAQISQARRAVEGSNRNTMGWFSELHDQTTGAVMFPPGWGQQMMQDHSLAPDARNGLFQAYTRLQQNGDLDASDPVLVSGLLRRMAANPYHSPDHPMPPEIIGLVGHAPSLEDSHQYRAFRGMAGGDQVLDENGNQKLPLGVNGMGVGVDKYMARGYYTGPQTGDPVIRGPQERVPTAFGNEDYDWVGAGKGVGGRGGLTMADAQFLAGRTGPQTPAVRDETHQLATAYDEARGQIGNPSAFQRFSNWFLGAYRHASSGDLGPADLLNPASKDYMLSPERMARFQPTGDDIIAPAVAATANEVRASLADIFSKPRGYAMRFEGLAEDGSTPRYKDATLGAPPKTIGGTIADFGSFLAGVPGAVARGAAEGWNPRSHEQVGAEAYREADANPIPTDGSRVTPTPPRETMATMDKE